MKNTTLLTVLGPDSDLAKLGATIEAARASNTHLSFMVATAVSQFSAYHMGIPPYGTMTVPDGWQAAIAAANKRLVAKSTQVKELLRAEGLPGDVKIVGCEPALLADTIAERAKLCDRAQIVADLRQNETVFGNALHGLLFASPVATLLNAESRPAPTRIFVAWNTGLPSARAVQQALPELKQAKEVTIATFDPIMMPGLDGENPGSDVAKWLSHHGCNVSVQQYPSGGLDIGQAILSRASELGADLVVAGAYGHSKLRQSIFGGTSQILIDQTAMPLLLAH